MALAPVSAMPRRFDGAITVIEDAGEKRCREAGLVELQTRMAAFLVGTLCPARRNARFQDWSASRFEARHRTSRIRLIRHKAVALVEISSTPTLRDRTPSEHSSSGDRRKPRWSTMHRPNHRPSYILTIWSFWLRCFSAVASASSSSSPCPRCQNGPIRPRYQTLRVGG